MLRARSGSASVKGRDTTGAPESSLERVDVPLSAGAPLQAVKALVAPLTAQSANANLRLGANFAKRGSMTPPKKHPPAPTESVP